MPERLYSIWVGIRQRVNNPKATGYKHYGGRGIRISSIWDNYLNFKDWANTNGYKDDLVLGRKDTNKNYTPENCHWVQKSFVLNNRRKFEKTNNNFIGVTLLPNGKWRSYITVNKEHNHIGIFESELLAAKARDKFIKDNGLSHKLNFEEI